MSSSINYLSKKILRQTLTAKDPGKRIGDQLMVVYRALATMSKEFVDPWMTYTQPIGLRSTGFLCYASA